MKRFWPSSLKGQVLLAIAAALLLAQGISAVLLYRAQHSKQESALLHGAAFRMVMAGRNGSLLPEMKPGPVEGPRRSIPLEVLASSPAGPGDKREADNEAELRQILTGQEFPVSDVVVIERPIREDPQSATRLAQKMARTHVPSPPEKVMIAAVRPQGSGYWLATRIWVPQSERFLLQTLLLQTLFIYAVLVGAMAFLLRRITRPIAALSQRLETFAETRSPDGQLPPEGPEDIRYLMEAHNRMEAGIVALLDEKDVMLGAIGHDLKTPLAALRVRIESVTDDVERDRMARTIEDITRSLDDILSLARVGRPTDMPERTELSALLASVVEEYEDMGEPVELGETTRAVADVRTTWLRRALRNLIGNSLRYGQRARVSLVREDGSVVIRIADDGPGIPEDELGNMLKPFTRGEPSRNTETGGSGLGLTLARAIAEQHGGSLELANRHDGVGKVTGLDAVLRLPLRAA